MNQQQYEHLRAGFMSDKNVPTFLPNAEAMMEMENRIIRRARVGGLITYSQLVEGIGFVTPLFNQGREPHFILGYDGWDGNERRMVGTVLAMIAINQWPTTHCLCTSIVVLARDSDGRQTPSDTFFRWLHENNVLPSLDEDTKLQFWLEQVRLTHNFYRPVTNRERMINRASQHRY